MEYAKLENEKIIYAKNPLQIDGQDVFTNDFAKYGYKPVVIPEQPTEEGYYAVFDGWEETDEAILQKWRLELITAEMEIAECKAKLAKTDYKAIKYAEGWYTEEEYALIKAERETLRELIRELENTVEENEDVNGN